MQNQSTYGVGDRLADSEKNEFVIESIVPHRDPLIDAAVILKGQGGEKEIGSLDLQFFTLLERRKYNFWKENKVSNHFTATIDEVKALFREWLPKKNKYWLEYYNSERVIRHFLAMDENGMLSVFEESEFYDLYHALKPMYMDFTYGTKTQ